MISAGLRRVPPGRGAEEVEDAAAGGAAVVEQRGAAAAVDTYVIAAPRTRGVGPPGWSSPRSLS